MKPGWNNRLTPVALAESLGTTGFEYGASSFLVEQQLEFCVFYINLLKHINFLNSRIKMFTLV